MEVCQGGLAEGLRKILKAKKILFDIHTSEKKKKDTISDTHPSDTETDPIPKLIPQDPDCMGRAHFVTFVKNAKGPFLSKTDKNCKVNILKKSLDGILTPVTPTPTGV